MHDIYATILYLLGLDHTRLVYKFQGRQFRLTDVGGHVVDKLLDRSGRFPTPASPLLAWRQEEWGTNSPLLMHDIYATILHLLGLDHTRLVYKFQGRQFRLMDVGGHVVDRRLA